MKYLFTVLFSASVICGVIFGKFNDISNSAVSAGKDTVNLFINLLGIMCLWSGLMNVAVKSGLTEKICRMFKPLIKFLFPDVDSNSKAAGAISMNMTASLLGLGNAVTPLGIAAMNELNKLNPNPCRASPSMIMLTVLNTASIQLVPTTIIAIRLSSGSASPSVIIPAVWLSSFVSVCAGIMVVKAMCIVGGKKL